MNPLQRAKAADAWHKSRLEILTDEEEAMWEAVGEWVAMEASAPAGIELGDVGDVVAGAIKAVRIVERRAG